VETRRGMKEFKSPDWMSDIIAWPLIQDSAEHILSLELVGYPASIEDAQGSLKGSCTL
jgi:hypothetical protein